MSEISFKFSAIPFYFEQAGWYTNNSIGYRNRLFCHWVSCKCKSYESFEIHYGKTIILKPGEFVYSPEILSKELGLSPKESRRRIDRGVEEGVFEKVKNDFKENKFTVYRYVTTGLNKYSQKKGQGGSIEENQEKGHGENPKGQGSGQGHGQGGSIEENQEKGQGHGQGSGQPFIQSLQSPEQLSLLKAMSKTMSGTMPFKKIDDGTLSKAKKYKLTPEQRASFEWLKEKNINTDDHTLSWWAKNYQFSRLRDVYTYATREDRQNLGGYINNILKNNIPVEDDNMRSNKQLAIDYKASNNWYELEIQEKYVVCKNMEIPLAYHASAFLQALMDLHTQFEINQIRKS